MERKWRGVCVEKTLNTLVIFPEFEDIDIS
jgi:hypothetical protein